jgi:hypothetical protein
MNSNMKMNNVSEDIEMNYDRNINENVNNVSCEYLESKEAKANTIKVLIIYY